MENSHGRLRPVMDGRAGAGNFYPLRAAVVKKPAPGAGIKIKMVKGTVNLSGQGRRFAAARPCSGTTWEAQKIQN